MGLPQLMLGKAYGPKDTPRPLHLAFLRCALTMLIHFHCVVFNGILNFNSIMWIHLNNNKGIGSPQLRVFEKQGKSRMIKVLLPKGELFHINVFIIKYFGSLLAQPGVIMSPPPKLL